jgi:hypothetical protein
MLPFVFRRFVGGSVSKSSGRVGGADIGSAKEKPKSAVIVRTLYHYQRHPTKALHVPMLTQLLSVA